MGIDTIPPKIVIMLRDDISFSMQSIANMMTDQSTFPDQAKISSVTPAFKKDDKMDKTNYRPISVLPCLSKILEKIIFEQMEDYFESIFSPYLCGFRKRYGCQHVLMQMTENWRKSLDHEKVIGALSMYLSKAFDSLQHDILIAKLHAYGFEMKALKLIYSYLINRTQTVKVKGEYSARRQVKAGVPQGSLLGVLLINVYLNDMFDSVQADRYNFADDNNLSTVGNTIDEAKAILITETDPLGLSQTKWLQTQKSFTWCSFLQTKRT